MSLNFFKTCIFFYSAVFSATVFCQPASPEFVTKIDEIKSAIVSGNHPQACLLSMRLQESLEANPATSSQSLKLVKEVQQHSCAHAMNTFQKQLNSPDCQRYQASKRTCAPAADYNTCMSRMGTSISNYAFICGD